MKKRLNILLLIVLIVLFACGISMPFISTTKFAVFMDSNSLLSSLKLLYIQNRWVLFLVVGVSTIVFPVLKLLIISLKVCSIKVSKDSNWLTSHIATWSFIDVFVVAIYVVIQKQTWWFKLELGAGFYAFLAFGLITFALSIARKRELR